MAERRGLRRYSIGDLAEPALHLFYGDRAQTVTRARESHAALAALAIALATSCAGCFGASALTLAPVAAAGAAQLLGNTPGVEEVRKTLDGMIESRQWKIVQHEGNPAWMLVRAHGSSEDAWQPQPGITTRNFKPPLYQVLQPKQSQFLAYAPADVTSPADSEQFSSMTAAFGAGIGTFEWRDRTYSFVVVKELPCFKPVE
jgi:hypothetical protein